MVQISSTNASGKAGFSRTRSSDRKGDDLSLRQLQYNVNERVGGDFFERRNDLRRWVLAEDFYQLASIPSPTGDEGKISRYIQGFLRNNLKIPKVRPVTGLSAPVATEPYFVVEPESGSILIYCPGVSSTGKKPPLLLWDTHMDTVSIGEEKAAVENKTPISVLADHKKDENNEDDVIFRSDGKTVLGADAKTSIATSFEYLRMLKVLRENNIPHAASIILISTGEEEAAVGAQKIPLRYLRYDDTNPAAMIALDHTGFDLDTIYPAGFQTVKWNAEVNRKSDGGVNPLKPVAEFAREFQIGYRERALNDRVTANIGSIDVNKPEREDGKGTYNSYPFRIDLWARVHGRKDVAQTYADQQYQRFEKEVKAFELQNRSLANHYLRQSNQSPEDQKKVTDPVSFPDYSQSFEIYPVPGQGDAFDFHAWIKGVSSHSASFPQPGKGINPITPMARFLYHLLDDRPKDVKTDVLGLEVNNKSLDEAKEKDKAYNPFTGVPLKSVHIDGEFRSTKQGEAVKAAQKERERWEMIFKKYHKLLAAQFNIEEFVPAYGSLEDVARKPDMALMPMLFNQWLKRDTKLDIAGGSDVNVLSMKFPKAVQDSMAVAEWQSGYMRAHALNETASLNAMEKLTLLQVLYCCLLAQSRSA